MSTDQSKNSNLTSLTEDVASIKSSIHDILDEMQAARAEVKDIVKIKAANQIPVQLHIAGFK